MSRYFNSSSFPQCKEINYVAATYSFMKTTTGDSVSFYIVIY